MKPIKPILENLLNSKVYFSEKSYGSTVVEKSKNIKSGEVLLLENIRFNREEENDYKKINSIIKFEYVQSSKSKNIDHHNLGQELELLTINVLKKDNNFEIILLFSRNRIITLGVEIIEVTLEDQKFINDKNT